MSLGERSLQPHEKEIKKQCYSSRTSLRAGGDGNRLGKIQEKERDKIFFIEGTLLVAGGEQDPTPERETWPGPKSSA